MYIFWKVSNGGVSCPLLEAETSRAGQREIVSYLLPYNNTYIKYCQRLSTERGPSKRVTIFGPSMIASEYFCVSFNSLLGLVVFKW